MYVKTRDHQEFEAKIDENSRAGCFLGQAWRAHLMRISVILAPSDIPGEGLACRSDAYLRDSRSLGHCWGKAWDADLVHIYVIFAPLDISGGGLGYRFDAYWHDSRISLEKAWDADLIHT